MRTKAVPVTLVTGFLGAGKTSLLNHILRADHGLRIAVLVNDFGAINIDSELIVGVEGETISLSNGCICCTIRGDLLKAVGQLIFRDPPPDYLVIETSGVSDPIVVAETFLLPELQQYARLDAIVTVVDAEQVRTLAGEQAALAMAQVAAADIVVLNKVDLVTPGELDAVQAWIREIVDNARILETAHGQAPLELLLAAGNFSPKRLTSRRKAKSGHEHEHEHEHDHSMVFDTWSYQADEPLIYSALSQAIDRLPATIYRAKGILWLADAPDRKSIFHLVGKRAMLSLGGKWGTGQPRTQLVAIGSHGGFDPAQLQLLFDACRASRALAHRPDILAAMQTWART